mgnify:CR=1 FL=1
MHSTLLSARTIQRSSKPESLSFARGHLLNWLPGFSTDVAKYAETPFYAAAAQIALAFTQLDASMVEELLKELHGTAGEISA